MDKLATTPAFVTRHQLTALRHWRTSPKQNGRKESVDWLLRMELALVIHASRLEPLTPTILRNRITAMWATPSTPTLDVTMGSKTWIPGLYRSDEPGHLLLVEVDPVQVSCVICKDVSCPPPCSGFDRCGFELAHEDDDEALYNWSQRRWSVLRLSHQARAGLGSRSDQAGRTAYRSCPEPLG